MRETVTEMQYKGIWFWQNVGRFLSIIAMLLAGIWMWYRAYSGIQNPNLLPLISWALFSSTLLWSSHFGVVRFWEALLGFSAGIGFAIVVGLIVSGQSLIEIFLSVTSPAVLEALCQKGIDQRVKVRL